MQVVAGLVYSSRTMRNKRGETLAFTVLDDRSGRIELSVFADVYEQHKAKLFKDAVLVVEGEVQQDDYSGALKMRVSQIHTMDDARRRFADCLQIEVSGDGHAARPCPAPENAARTAPSRRLSGCDRIPLRSRRRAPRLGADWRVAPSDELLQSLRNEFGAGQVGLHYRRSAA